MNEQDFAKGNRRVARATLWARALVVGALTTGLAWFWLRATLCWESDSQGAVADAVCDWLFTLPVCLYGALGIQVARIVIALAWLGRLSTEGDEDERFLVEIRMSGRVRIHWWLYHVNRGYELAEIATKEAARSAMRLAIFATVVLVGFLLWYRWEISPRLSLGLGGVAAVAAYLMMKWFSGIGRPRPRPVPVETKTPVPAGAAG